MINALLVNVITFRAYCTMEATGVQVSKRSNNAAVISNYPLIKKTKWLLIHLRVLWLFARTFLKMCGSPAQRYILFH